MLDISSMAWGTISGRNSIYFCSVRNLYNVIRCSPKSGNIKLKDKVEKSVEEISNRFNNN